jgi:riboflavin synthase
MFTGIVEGQGEIMGIDVSGSNKTFWVKSDLWNQLRTDESVSHDGVCLTIEEIQQGGYRVTAILETLEKTNLGNWKNGTKVNLERSMPLNGRIDGHIVQGHVDSTATCTARKELDGSIEFSFRFKKKFAPLIIEKGSVCINGVSLTAFNVGKKKFTVAVIPYTLTHTNLSFLEPGSIVNIEFDMLGKYVNRIKKLNKKKP